MIKTIYPGIKEQSMFIGEYLNQGKYRVVEKINPPKVVAFLQVQDLEEVGKCIWKMRDWIAARGGEPSEAPCCVFQPVEARTRAKTEEIRGEVQWELPAEEPARPGPAPARPASTGWVPRNGGRDGGVKIKRLEAERVLSTYHEGDTDEIDRSVRFLETVVGEAGYRATGPRREIYLFDVHFPKSKWITEIQIPVEKLPTTLR